MRISARCDYACRAMLELSQHWRGKEPVQIHTISERQNIPLRYLVHILIQLKRIGLVISVRGKDGGYYLAKAPDQITLGEVMSQVSGPFLPLADSAAKSKPVFSAIWKKAEEAMAGVLDEITFEDISQEEKNMKGTISYQI